VFCLVQDFFHQHYDIYDLVNEIGIMFSFSQMTLRISHQEELILPETNSSHLQKWHLYKETIVFQPSIFRGFGC